MKIQRLSKREQFSGVYRDGTRIDTDAFTVLYQENHLSRSRFAVVVSKRFGTAVRRNKAKRKARGLFHLFHGTISPACDILVFPKKAILTQQSVLLIGQFRQALERAHLCKVQS